MRLPTDGGGGFAPSAAALDPRDREPVPVEEWPGGMEPYGPGPSPVSGMPPDWDGAGAQVVRVPGVSDRDLFDAMAAALGEKAACGLEAFAEMLCRCIVSRLQKTQIGVAIGGHVNPPTRAKQLFGLTGVDDATPVNLPAGGAAAAFVDVLTIANLSKAVGAMYAFGHGLDNAFHWPIVEHRITIGSEIVAQWFGQIGELSRPFYPKGWTLGRGERFVYSARNTSAVTAVNAQAVGWGWQFQSTHYEAGHKEPESYRVDGG